MRSFDDDRPRDAGAEALPAAPPPLTPTVAERVAERVAEASKRIVCVPPASARSLGVVRAHDAKAQLNRVSAVAVPPGAKHAALRKRLASLLADTQSAAHNADAARLLTALREHEVESRAKSRAAFARLRRGDAAHLSCGRERLQTASSARDAWRRPPSAALEGRRAPAATTLNGRPAAADGPARPRTVLARPRTALLARSADLPKLVRSKSLV
ncbi:hypothetical protein M885DRAFT_506644 [Pelagophyceae sp. CCMP2097]|nr:hypothetical protein M885DRAFT_506644 [Pelagophyceae sp. CCMP2097]